MADVKKPQNEKQIPQKKDKELTTDQLDKASGGKDILPPIDEKPIPIDPPPYEKA